MAIEQLDIEIFLKLSETCPVIDVRSPGEYLHAHIPGASTLPLFTDEQRKNIGTAYKQQSRQIAVNIGLEYFSDGMKVLPAEAERLLNEWKKNKGIENATLTSNPVLVHCWRGGMRSGAVAWLLNLYGFKIYTLKGGYKSFRNWAISQFEKEYKLNILGGYTGSGKTSLLKTMKESGNFVIDLEGLANHKGSAFGTLGESPQPGQEMFENILAMELHRIYSAIEKNTNTPDKNGTSSEIWIEDESKHIGSVGIPRSFWDQMRKSSLFFLDIPFEERLNQIVENYGSFDKNDLVDSIMKIKKRLGGLETKNAIDFLMENKIKNCFSILLRYYDKLYENSLYKRENPATLLNKIPCKTVDSTNSKKLFLAQT
jgi:tRNA 2-selenouridine synthase